MKHFILSILLIFGACISLQAQENVRQFRAKGNGQSMRVQKAEKDSAIKRRAMVEENGDTVILYNLRTVWVYPPMKFKNRRQEKFYWKTVRDVKKTLPLVGFVKQVMKETNDTLMTMKSNRERRKYMRGWERRLYKREEGRMKKLTLSQGKMLIKLVGREMDTTSYDLIKAYRGSFRAGFYNLFASMFGASLKVEYGKSEEDEIIERVINLVESGQL